MHKCAHDVCVAMFVLLGLVRPKPRSHALRPLSLPHPSSSLGAAAECLCIHLGTLVPEHAGQGARQEEGAGHRGGLAGARSGDSRPACCPEAEGVRRSACRGARAGDGRPDDPGPGARQHGPQGLRIQELPVTSARTRRTQDGQRARAGASSVHVDRGYFSAGKKIARRDGYSQYSVTVYTEIDC